MTDRERGQYHANDLRKYKRVEIREGWEGNEEETVPEGL